MSGEWARHLRPLLQRAFWKGERQAERRLIREEGGASVAERVGIDEAHGLTTEQRDSGSSAQPKRLYDFPFSGNGYKVRLALAHLGLSVEYETVDLVGGETNTPRFLAKNPMGQIPVLELDDGTMLRESNSILFWLTEGTSLMPDDRLARARIVQWMCFEQSNIDKVLGRTRFLKRYPDFMATTSADWEQWYATGYRALDVMESELRKQGFLVADAFSAADICLYGYVHCAEEGGFDLARYGAVNRWRARVREQPGHVPIDRVGARFPR